MDEERQVPVVYGTTWCPDCRRAQLFLGEQRVEYQWVDIEKDSEAMAYVEEVNDGRRSVPTIVFPDGRVLVEPTNAQLAEQLGLRTAAERTFYDVVVVGGGPAGITAAIYTAREGLDTLVIERAAPGGQAAITQVIDNYPGFVEGITGAEFARRLTEQAGRFEVEILQAQEVREVRTNGRYREVVTADGSCYAGRALLLATGARYRRLEVPGEQELIGINVHFCATCDGAFYRDKEVMVVGGGNSAFEESLFLTRYASRVRIAVRGPTVSASRFLREQVARHGRIEVITDCEIREFVVRDGRLAGVRALNRGTGEEVTWHPDGVFVFIGMHPNTEFLPPEIERDRRGFVLTDSTHQTTIRGVFAAGDVRAGATPQLASAAGEGATAALLIREYLERQV